ncbi:tRNA uracil 4-sulfurtransferase ThiI [Jeotgalibacillus haloalkalitolerans]|uniref:Probable tRNA sulfurtransferase n=1 Tax=Jeotgalibacillus haloalkalitolerans TaxID=3104292 RepID=A0ABU5KNG0_9BACL|nr:tRNA uracil 4-sulfurtransferase ThiI [Jeotgalibacillus sp. HH7-29]MDZ5712481.1 tRNA uracil 4-sulfurtransferase ThiI [Jeotgalibacillus sp. HH7-29]
MQIDRILIRYGEISTKGRNRNKFIKRLQQNISDACSDLSPFRIESGRDRMHLELNHPEEAQQVMERLELIFGIQSFSPVVKSGRELEEVKQHAVQLVQSVASEGTLFKVRARRADKNYPLDTNELNYEIGSHVLRQVPGLKVEMKKPEVELTVEVRSEAVYLSAQTIQGAGGMPIGSGNKAVLMLSGGLDSPVAGYQMMKRGVELEAVHFFSPPFTSEKSKEKVMQLASELAGFSGSVKLHIVPFTKIQQTIHQQVPENYTMTSTRRLMLRIADEIKKKTGSKAIVTGESLGQVASQTLESMEAINAVTNTPVLRPLIASDKTDIIEIAKKIGTFETSILPYEDCCTIFTPAAPKTRPKTEKVAFYESFIDFDEMIRQSVEEIETIILKPGYKPDDVEDTDLF